MKTARAVAPKGWSHRPRLLCRVGDRLADRTGVSVAEFVEDSARDLVFAADVRDRDALFQHVEHLFLVVDQSLELDSASDGSSDADSFGFFECECLFGSERDEVVLDLGDESEGEGQHLAVDVVVEGVSVFGAVDGDLFLHAGVQDRHDVEECSAEPGEFGDDERVALFEPSDECTEPSFGTFRFPADNFGDPFVDGDPSFFGEFRDFELLIFEMLFFGADSQISDNHSEK